MFHVKHGKFGDDIARCQDVYVSRETLSCSERDQPHFGFRTQSQVDNFAAHTLAGKYWDTALGVPPTEKALLGIGQGEDAPSENADLPAVGMPAEGHIRPGTAVCSFTGQQYGQDVRTLGEDQHAVFAREGIARVVQA